MEAIRLVDIATTPGSFVLCGRDDFKLMLVGSSLLTSAAAGAMYHSITFVPQRDKNGVIALIVTGGAMCPPRVFLIPVTWNESGYFVDLKNPFVCRPDRLGQMTMDGMYVIIDGVRYDSSCKATPGIRYVPDANILCKYLVGEVNPDQVMAAADEYVVEQTAREETKLLKRRVSDLEEELANKHAAWKEDLLRLADAGAKAKDAQECLKALQRMWDEQQERLATRLRVDFGITDAVPHLDKLIDRYTHEATKRIVNRNNTLKELGASIQKLEQAVKMPWWNPWRWLEWLPKTAENVVATARENEVLPEIPARW